MRNKTQSQIESIVLDSAILFINYGEADQEELGFSKGGVEFNVTESKRDIEYDGRRGKTKGLEVVDEINAYLKVTTLETTNAHLLNTLGSAALASGVLTNGTGGAIGTGRYVSNVTAFCINNKTATFKKIVIYNALGEGGFTMATSDKGEAAVDITFNAHWDPLDVTSPIYQITDGTTGPDTVTALFALTVATAAGATGKSVVTISRTASAGHGFVYKTGTSAETVTFDQALTSWTPIISGATITPASTHTVITVAEINGADSKAKGAGSATLNIG